MAEKLVSVNRKQVGQDGTAATPNTERGGARPAIRLAETCPPASHLTDHSSVSSFHAAMQ